MSHLGTIDLFERLDTSDKHSTGNEYKVVQISYTTGTWFSIHWDRSYLGFVLDCREWVFCLLYEHKPSDSSWNQ